MRHDEVQQFIARVAQEPSLRGEPVTIILESDTEVINSSLIAAHGGRVRYQRGRAHQISIPADRLATLLDQLPPTVSARFSYPFAPTSVTGQGVAITGAADMQALGRDGAGITIGIIDMGFGSLAAAQASGDLPASMTVLDYTGSGTGGSTHGTNVAQIAYEMAPGASMYLAKISTHLEMQQAVDDMVAAGVDVIVESLVWFGGAFYDGTGPICDATVVAEQGGIQWVNAAGNHRNKHYLGTFADTNGDLRHEFASGQNYNTASLTAGVGMQLVLNWDAYPATKIDYDLYLYNGNPDAGGAVVGYSTTKPGPGPNGGIEPYEIISYTPTTSGVYYIVVRKASTSTQNLPFTLFVSSGPDLGVKTTASSLAQPADCSGVIGVAAANLSDVVESYSSEGPTTDGRAKPEVTAPSGVQTSLTTSFGGTSAATPHVGGAVALLMAQNSGSTLPQIRTLLTAATKDIYTAGYDYRTGSGRISLDADGDGFNHDADNCDVDYNTDQADADSNGVGDACEPPVVTGFWPGNAVALSTIKVYGNYFVPEATQVLFNGIPAFGYYVLSPTRMQAILPQGDTAGPITVTTAHGTAVSPLNFGISMDQLAITGFYPGSASPLAMIKVFGANFVSEATQVYFNGVPAWGYYVLSPTRMQVIVPSGATSGPITVTTAEGTVISVSNFIIK